MGLKYFRKLFIVLIILTPIFTDLACKKQPKCGCGEDAVFELVKESVYVYFDTVSLGATFTNPKDPYSSFSFCNPEDMMSTLSKYNTGSLLKLSGKVFYECNYILNSSSNPYYAQYKVYLVEVTDVYEDLYGKK